MPDKRSVKTVNAIRCAFEQMLIEQNSVIFTIKEITAKANINRKTFYLHFSCIEDLYKDLEDRIEQKWLEILNDKGFFTEKFSLKIFLDSLADLYNLNCPLYEKLLTCDNYKFVFRKKIYL